MNRRTFFPAFGALSVLALAVTACGGGSSGGANAVDTNEFRIAWNAQPPTLDPLMSTATSTRDIARNIYEPLLAFDENEEIQPVLASAYEVSDDRKSITFTLRDDVLFHDGSPMEAGDVVASLERWITTSNAGITFFKGATVVGKDEDTVVLTTPEAMHTTAILLADPSQQTAIQPAEIIAGAAASGVTDYIGTGPYSLVEWETDQNVHLKKFEDYTSPEGETSGLAGAKTPVFENLYFDFVTDPSTRVAGLQTGEYDAANALLFDTVEQLEADPNLETVISDNGFNGLIFNKRQGLMANPAMRHAVNAALDLEAVQTAAFAKPEFFNLNGALMSEEQTAWYTEAGLDKYNVNDPGLVTDYLEEAGYAGETVRILTTREYDDHYNAAVVIESQLNAAGITTELTVTDWATVLQNRADDTAYEMFITGFGSVSIPTRHLFLTNSWAGWTNDPAIDAAMSQITYAATEDEASKAAADLQQAFYDYLPMVKFGDKKTVTSHLVDYSGYRFVPGAGDVFYDMKPAE